MKNYVLGFIVPIICLAVTGIVSFLQAQTDHTTKVPISFFGLERDQEISFSVYTDHPQASFGIEVSMQPQPQAKIRLYMSSSIQIEEAEKIWGHPAGEQVTRSLTPVDLQTLESFLTAHRAKGVVPPPAVSGNEAMTFEQSTYRPNREGHLHADIDRNEYYPVLDAVQRDFIKNFIGFKG